MRCSISTFAQKARYRRLQRIERRRKFVHLAAYTLASKTLAKNVNFTRTRSAGVWFSYHDTLE